MSERMPALNEESDGVDVEEAPERTPRTPPEKGPEASVPSRSDSPPATVLIVEDNPDTLRVMKRTLALERYAILSATDGEEALAVARSRKPDVILLDVMIPKIDGLEVLNRLKADPATRSIMILLVTGRASLDHRVQGLEAGADDYIPKPFHLPELIARVRSALRMKRLTDDLQKRNRELVTSQRSLLQSKKMATIGLLASGIAHEFNNIMAGISGYAQLARKDPRYRETLVDVALTQTERALELTRSLSTYNRGGGENLRSDVVKVVENALCLVAKELEQTDVRVTKEYVESPWVNVSPGNLQEVILNLVINAIQAVEDGTGFVKVRVASASDPKGVVIEISDSGVGIPEENLERIFDPFFTTKGALGGGPRSGTGLGLTVCYNIVSTHGGSIEVSSRLGSGTTFQVTLPRADAPAEGDARSLRFDEEATPAPSRPLRILVIDDERTEREMIRDYLSDHEVVACARVEEGLEAYAIRPFDYVILDVAIEGSINGLQAFDRFSRFDPPPRVIFASGRFPDEIYREYIERAHGSLLKPFKFEELIRLLGLPVPAPTAPAVEKRS